MKLIYPFIQLILAISLAASCDPPELLDLKSRTRPTDSRLAKDIRTGPAEATSSMMNLGLPLDCSYARSTENGFCLGCRLRSGFTERCFTASESFVPDSDCYHSRRKLRCTLGKQAGYFEMALASTPESKLVQAIPEVINTVKYIARDKLDEEAKETKLAFAIMGFFVEEANQIYGELFPREFGSHLIKRLGVMDPSIEAKIDKLVQDRIKRIRVDRRNGHISIKPLVKLLEILLVEISPDSILLQVVREVNYDGLDNPEDFIRLEDALIKDISH